MNNKKKKKDDFVRISLNMKVDGKIVRRRQRTYYARGRETLAFTLEDFASILFMWDKMMGAGSTYVMDGLLQKMEKVMPKRNSETAEELFQKYWVSYQDTLNKKFEELNKGDKNEKFPLFPEAGDYLLFRVGDLCDAFVTAPLPIKYGFLHFLHKYVMNESIDEYKKDIDNIPAQIAKMVDGLVKKATKTS